MASSELPVLPVKVLERWVAGRREVKCEFTWTWAVILVLPLTRYLTVSAEVLVSCKMEILLSFRRVISLI